MGGDNVHLLYLVIWQSLEVFIRSGAEVSDQCGGITTDCRSRTIP